MSSKVTQQADSGSACASPITLGRAQLCASLLCTLGPVAPPLWTSFSSAGIPRGNWTYFLQPVQFLPLSRLPTRPWPLLYLPPLTKRGKETCVRRPGSARGSEGRQAAAIVAG